MSPLAERLDAIDRDLLALEGRMAVSRPQELREFLAPAIDLVKRTMMAYIETEGSKPVPPPETDLLDVWKALVKGDPTWNSVRDNARELVFYRNCLDFGREDALPAAPQKMAVRTARHIYLYVRSRCVRDGRLADT